MSGLVQNVRQKLKRKVSHKDPNINFDDDDQSGDEETTSYVNKEVDDNEKDGDKYPEGRPNSFLNRMISHGNQKTEKQIAADYAAHQEREKLKSSAIGAGQTSGAAQHSVNN